uniref:PRELI/MSF1 domain-containing protein n=1 Tax=Clytia hemisphaerica TaxID=252671 RepID=A0A7M6DPN5_9CNID|eukprot:TCONS_00053374-protein
MRFNESVQILHHTWLDICSVFYKRYPNPQSKHVLGEDVIKRSLDENNVLKTTRIFAKTNEVPGWLMKFLPTATVYILEESHIDIQNHLITTYTRNITHNTLLSVEERCVFSIDTDNKELTSVQRRAWIESYFPGLKPVFERFGLSRYNSNIQRMHRGFTSVLGGDSSTRRTSTTATSQYRQSDVHVSNGIQSTL